MKTKAIPKELRCDALVLYSDLLLHAQNGYYEVQLKVMAKHIASREKQEVSQMRKADWIA